MSVYVDNMRRTARPAGYRGWGAPSWSHLFADTPMELRRFAVETLGLSPAWLQNPGTHREHFDVTETVRAKAVALGAQEITYPHGTADLLERRREQCKCRALSDCQWAQLVI